MGLTGECGGVVVDSLLSFSLEEVKQRGESFDRRWTGGDP